MPFQSQNLFVCALFLTIPTAMLLFIFYKMPVIFIDVEEVFYDGRTPGGN